MRAPKGPDRRLGLEHVMGVYTIWMFAQVAQGKMTPAEASRAAERQMKTIFAKWRRRKKI